MRHELLSSYLACTPAGCDAVISALGHNLTLRGMYGAPRKLCTDTVSQLCRVAEMLQPARPIRLIAISTEGVDRPDGADPPRGRAERLVTSSNPDPDPDPDPDRNPDPDPSPIPNPNPDPTPTPHPGAQAEGAVHTQRQLRRHPLQVRLGRRAPS